MMKNLKLNLKLLISFGLVLLMLLICAGVAILKMNTLGTQIDQYADKTVPNVEYVWEMRRNMVSTERNLVSAIATKDQSRMNEYIDMADKDSESIFSVLEVFTKNTRLDQEMLKMLTDSFNKIVPVHEQITELLKKGEKEKAYNLYETQYSIMFDDSNEILLDVAESQKQRAEEQSTTAHEALNSGIIILIVTVISAILIILIVMASLKKAILIPVKEIHLAAKAIANGDLSATITYDGKDEFGELANAMKALLHTVVGILKDLDYGLGEIGSGNFTVESKSGDLYKGDFSSIDTSMIQIIANLSSTILQISQASEQVACGSDQVSSGAQALSQGATEQASSIEELSASIAEITGQIKQNAENARLANNSAELAGKEIFKSNEHMKDMVDAMDKINLKSSEISKIIKVIEDIAFQTNILALNAAVEAARAGAAGKGFAVVADEVRNLASKSAQAAKGTTNLIEETLVAVQNGSKIVSNTAKSLDESAKVTKEAVLLIDKIAEASNQQAQSANQINIGVDQIASVIQTNSATAEESAAASEELNGQAEMLKNLVGNFRLKTIV
ncbi:MAG: methyl-accepting chemotaxis protein [Sedimentibacter sp.]